MRSLYAPITFHPLLHSHKLTKWEGACLYNYAGRQQGMWPNRTSKRGNNTEACSCNHCCSKKAMSTTYSECMFVALDTQHEKYSYIRCAPLYTIFPHYLTNGTIKKNHWTQNVCLDDWLTVHHIITLSPTWCTNFFFIYI